MLIADEVKLKKDIPAKQVVDFLKEKYASPNNIVYYKYPIYRGDLADELRQAEILLVSPDYGVLYFKCNYEGELSKSEIEYLEDLDSHIYKRFIGEQELRKDRRTLKFDVKGIVVGAETKLVDNIQYSTLGDLPSVIEPCKLINPLTEHEFSILVSSVDNTRKLKIKKQRNVVKQEGLEKRKGEILEIIQQKETCFDNEQRKAAMSVIDSPQRIRGLAGSGKTILLTMKAALYHLSNPDAEILYTYYTKDLYDLIRRLIERFYREAADNHEPNWQKIHIYHAWGGAELPGVYSSVCKDVKIQPITFQTARTFNSKNPFAYVCSRLLEIDLPKRYDLTLIDEGQDFPNEFYQLCYRITKNRRIVWAYDEFQNIFDVELQDEKKTFGKNENDKYLVDFERHENPNEDIVLHCCYRTPRQVLIAAFSLGLGIYHTKVLQRLESNTHWESLGFSIEKGTCRTGEEMIVSRPIDNTPSVEMNNSNIPSLSIETFEDNILECQHVSNCIMNDIENEGLLPDDICVICLDTKNIASYYTHISRYLNDKNIHTFNMLNAPNANKKFSFEGCVTLATLNKAKGNETGMVYIVGTDSVFNKADNVIERNKLFTAMTRAKGWVHITGSGSSMSKCKDELAKLQDCDYKLVFNQPSTEQTKTVMQGSIRQQSELENLFKSISTLQSSGMTLDELIDYIKKK